MFIQNKIHIIFFLFLSILTAGLNNGLATEQVAKQKNCLNSLLSVVANSSDSDLA